MESPGPIRSQETWDSMLPGPPSRNNGAAVDCSPAGLLAYAAGSSVVIADPRSVQLVCVLPMPGGGAASSSPMSSLTSASSSSLAPFVTSVRWTPQPLSRDPASLDDPSNSHLRLAVGDRQGRIALWDLRSRQISLWLDLLDPTPSHSSNAAGTGVRPGIQDLCWVLSNSWLLVSLHGPSLLALWNAATGRCVWKYDASPEYLSCVRRDPYDSRHFCALGLRGFLLSAIVLGDGGEGASAAADVSVQEHQIPTDASDLHKLERDSSPSSPSAPAMSVFPLYFARFSFSPRWRHILLVSFPKELVVFDLQYGTALSTTLLPRGCSKFMDLLPDPEADLIYCVHLDGKLSTWKRKE